jgi:hypothetical protein
MKRKTSHLSGFSSGASLGGKVSRYRDKQNIYKQGERRLHALVHSRRRGAAQYPNETATICSDRDVGALRLDWTKTA